MTTTERPRANDPAMHVTTEHNVFAIDNVAAEADLVLHCVDAAKTLVSEMDFGLPGDKRNWRLDQVNGLLNLIHFRMAALVEEIDTLPRPKDALKAAGVAE